MSGKRLARTPIYPFVSRSAFRVLQNKGQAVSATTLATAIGLNAPNAVSALPNLLDGRFYFENEHVSLHQWDLPFPPKGENILVMDLEATGGSTETDALIEVAAIRINNDGTMQEFERLINPNREIPPFVARMTGIDQNMVKNAPNVETVLAELLPLFEDATVVMQDARGDLALLANHFDRLRFKLTRPIVDTLNLSRRALPGRRKRGLDALARVFDLPPQQRHRALGDARLTLAAAQQLYFSLTRNSAPLLSEIDTPTFEVVL